MPTVNETRSVPYGAPEDHDWNVREYRPGEYVGHRSGSYGGVTDSVEFIEREARTAADAMTAIQRAGETGNVVSLAHAEGLRAAYEALDNLDRHLPQIAAWTCGYWWGGSLSDDRAWSTWSAHWTEKAAKRWLERWIAEWPNRGRPGMDWAVRFMPVRVTDLMERRADPRVVVRGIAARLS